MFNPLAADLLHDLLKLRPQNRNSVFSAWLLNAAMPYTRTRLRRAETVPHAHKRFGRPARRFEAASINELSYNFGTRIVLDSLDRNLKFEERTICWNERTVVSHPAEWATFTKF